MEKCLNLDDVAKHLISACADAKEESRNACEFVGKLAEKLRAAGIRIRMDAESFLTVAFKAFETGNIQITYSLAAKRSKKESSRTSFWYPPK